MTGNALLEQIKERGISVATSGGRTILHGENTGTTKPHGPLAGKKIGLLVAPEFSDFQAYYLVEYLSELGASVQFIGAEGSYWKYTRPTDPTKGVQGMWGMSLTPIPVLGESRCTYVKLDEAKPADYDAIVTLGGHSADILTTTEPALTFLSEAAGANVVLGAIGEGTLPLIRQRLVEGQKCTGNNIVSYMLRRLGEFVDEPVVRDGSLITCRGTEYCGEFVREIARHFSPDFEDPYADCLAGKRIVVIAGEDFEDIELVVPVLELLHRGAELTLATFPAPMRARPPLLGVDVVMGNFGVSVPLQDIPGDRYRIAALSSIDSSDFDVVMIPGAFCPWNMVAAGSPIQWLKKVHDDGKFIAAICHGAIPLSAAGIVEGRALAGVGACRDHVSIMGGEFNADASAIVDGTVISGRVPPDVPEFLDAITLALS